MKPIAIARMRRIATIAIGLFVALSTATPIALVGAQAPPTDVGDPFPKPVKGLCKFPVDIELSGQSDVIELPGGGFIVTSPGLTATLTNVNNPENQVSLNITGTITQTVLENGDVQRVLRGRNLFFDPSVGFVLLIGNFTAITGKKDTLLEPLDEQGQIIDICALLS